MVEDQFGSVFIILRIILVFEVNGKKVLEFEYINNRCFNGVLNRKNRWRHSGLVSVMKQTSCSIKLCFCGFYSSERITMSPFGCKVVQFHFFNTLYCDCFPADSRLDLIKEQFPQFTASKANLWICTLLTPTGSIKAVQ